MVGSDQRCQDNTLCGCVTHGRPLPDSIDCLLNYLAASGASTCVGTLCVQAVGHLEPVVVLFQVRSIYDSAHQFSPYIPQEPLPTPLQFVDPIDAAFS